MNTPDESDQKNKLLRSDMFWPGHHLGWTIFIGLLLLGVIQNQPLLIMPIVAYWYFINNPRDSLKPFFKAFPIHIFTLIVITIGLAFDKNTREASTSLNDADIVEVCKQTRTILANPQGTPNGDQILYDLMYRYKGQKLDVSGKVNSVYAFNKPGAQIYLQEFTSLQVYNDDYMASVRFNNPEKTHVFQGDRISVIGTIEKIESGMGDPCTVYINDARKI
jgi:hypothetical protein